MYTFTINTWSKIDVETIKYKGKKWINEKDLEKALGCKHLAGNKTQYYSDEFKKRRCKIQDCEDYQSCRKFIAEELAIHLILDTKTVKAGERLRKLFPIEEIIEDFQL